MVSAPTLPGFSRVEISAAGKTDLIVAAAELRLLAGELEFIAGQPLGDETATILAHHKIKTTSKKLRRKP